MPLLRNLNTEENRAFWKSIDDAVEEVKWFPKWNGGDGRLEEARELWYAKYPEEDPRN